MKEVEVTNDGAKRAAQHRLYTLAGCVPPCYLTTLAMAMPMPVLRELISRGNDLHPVDSKDGRTAYMSRAYGLVECAGTSNCHWFATALVDGR